MLKEIIHSLGEQIKKDIKDKNLNGSAIARKMNVSRQVINQIDLRKKFDLDFLLKLKEASGLDYTQYAFSNSISKIQEPSLEYSRTSNKVELALTIKINADQNDLGLLSELIKGFKSEAQKYGFTLV